MAEELLNKNISTIESLLSYIGELKTQLATQSNSSQELQNLKVEYKNKRSDGKTWVLNELEKKKIDDASSVKGLEKIVAEMMQEKDGVEINKEAKKIQDDIDKVNTSSTSSRNSVICSTLLVSFKKTRDLIITGGEITKKAVISKKDELEKVITKLELEIRQHEAIQVINDELNDKRDEGKVKLQNGDLIEPDYINFEQKVFKLNSEKKINDFENELIVYIAKLRKIYDYLDNLIAKGNKALEDKDKRIAQGILNIFEIHYEISNDEEQKVYDQRLAKINELENKLKNMLKP